MDELFADFERIHQEILLPEVERIFQASERRLTERMVSLVDSLSLRLDRLESGGQIIHGQVRRIEQALEG